jgi:hypothetical protein
VRLLCQRRAPQGTSVSRPFSTHETTVYLFMTSQLETQFRELNNVSESKSTAGGAQLENCVIRIPKTTSKEYKKIQDVITGCEMFCT